MTISCPFCECDPYEYVDNGLFMEAVAVTCCELGMDFFDHRHTSEQVTMSREEFMQMGSKIQDLKSLDRASGDGVLRDLVREVVGEDREFIGLEGARHGAELCSRLAEAGWFKRARAALSAIPRGEVEKRHVWNCPKCTNDFVVVGNPTFIVCPSCNYVVPKVEPAEPLPPAGGWRLVPVDDDTRPFCDGLLPLAMIAAGEDALDNAENDLQNYVSGETIDWDNGMIAVAVYRAMLAAAPAPPASDKETT